MPELLDLSINETLARTLATSLTTILALIPLYIFGGEVIRGFTEIMIWGVFIGTYSTIYIATPRSCTLLQPAHDRGEAPGRGPAAGGTPRSSAHRDAAPRARPPGRAGLSRRRLHRLGRAPPGLALVLPERVLPWPVAALAELTEASSGTLRDLAGHPRARHGAASA
ncbi:MAG: hypothetical protein U1E17_14645 [Geminicoccaceae bacterium]